MKCECGEKIYNGMVWHGKKWDAVDWVMKFGAICVFCQAAKEIEAIRKSEKEIARLKKPAKRK